jgi:hypothetical protein
MKPRSPIEILVDKACGVEGDHEYVPPSASASEILLNVADEAIAWWEGKRPCGWSVDEHLNNPTVNVNPADHGLAEAVSSWVRIGGGK